LADISRIYLIFFRFFAGADKISQVLINRKRAAENYRFQPLFFVYKRKNLQILKFSVLCF